MFCNNCGAQVNEGSAFCPNCGAKIGAAMPGGNQPSGAAFGQTATYQPKKLTVSTLENISGKETETLGVVKGGAVMSKNVGKDLLAGFKNMAGGEIKSYTELASGARDMAFARMENDARMLGADAILGVRFTSAPLSVEGTVEVLVYGTAVKFKDAQ